MGEATAYEAPAIAVFWLYFRGQGDSVEQAMEEAEKFGSTLRGRINEVQLQPLELEVSAPAVPDARKGVAEVSARLDFSAAAFSKVENGTRLFARLCDAVASLGKGIGCEVVGPLMEPGNRDALTRSALASAVENAYPAGEIIAKSLKSSIYAVESVQVLEIAWNTPLLEGGVTPTLREVSCTARVRVLYTLAGQP